MTGTNHPQPAIAADPDGRKTMTIQATPGWYASAIVHLIRKPETERAEVMRIRDEIEEVYRRAATVGLISGLNLAVDGEQAPEESIQIDLERAYETLTGSLAVMDSENPTNWQSAAEDAQEALDAIEPMIRALRNFRTWLHHESELANSPQDRYQPNNFSKALAMFDGIHVLTQDG